MSQDTQEKQEQDLFPDFEVNIEDISLPEVSTETTEEEVTTETPVYAEAAEDEAIGLYKTLIDKGILFEDSETPFDGTWESLDKHIESLPDMVANSIIQQMPEAVQNLMDFALTKGDVTHEDLVEFFKLQEEDYKSSNSKINTIEAARAYMAKVMKSQNYEDDVIETTLDAMEDKGETFLINKAKSHADKTVSQKSVERLEAEKAQKAANLAKQQEYFGKLNQELVNLKYTDKRNQAIKENLDPRIIGTKNQAIQNSPKAVIQLADFYSYFDSKTGVFDLEAYSKQVASKEVSEFKKNLTRDNFSSSGTKSSGKSHQSSNKNGDELVPIF